MTKLLLRGYQREAIDAVFNAWAGGMQRPAIVLPTGAGKTVVFASLIKEFRRAYDGVRSTRVIVLAHRDELVDQAITKIRAIAPDLNVGKVKADDDDVYADVMVCSVQTLANERRRGRLKAAEGMTGHVGLIITDECFPAGTLVGGSPIEHLRPGDVIPSYSESAGGVELRPVVRVMKKRPARMVRVTLDTRETFACTPNHPILTEGGWCPAGGLWRGASVVSFTRDTNADMHGVRDPLRGVSEGQAGLLEEIRPGVLPGRVPGRVGVPGQIRADGTYESGARIGTDAAKEPHALCRDQGQDVRDAEADWAQAAQAGRERFGDAGAAEEACGVPGLADRVHDHSERRRASVPLQGGHRAPDDEGVRGGGRGVPFLAGSPVLRPSQGRTPTVSRVARVQVLEPGSDGTYGGVCPDGFVYNVEVDTTHTYLIGNGVVVHNCHHAAAASYKKIYAAFPDALQLGVTATMARGDGVGLGSTWEKVVYSRSILWMISKGYLTDVRTKQVDLKALDMGTVSVSRGDYAVGDLGRALMEAEADTAIARAYREHAGGRQGIVFTPTVETAEAACVTLNAGGLNARVISGNTHTDTRRQIYDQFQRGRTQVLVNCMVLTEGFDAPWAEVAVIARPTQSAPLYTQMVGRVLRPWPGKTEALVLDLVGASANKLRTLIDLEPGAVTALRDGESLAEAVVREAEEGDRKVPAGSVAFELKVRDVSSFAASSHAWVRTPGGVMFINCGENYVFLWPSKGQTGLWDVCVYRRGRKWERSAYAGLPVGEAMAWGEAVAEDYSPGFGLEKSSAWRRKKPSDAACGFAESLGITVTDRMCAGDVADQINRVKGGRVFDQFIGKG